MNYESKSAVIDQHRAATRAVGEGRYRELMFRPSLAADESIELTRLVGSLGILDSVRERDERLIHEYYMLDERVNWTAEEAAEHTKVVAENFALTNMAKEGTLFADAALLRKLKTKAGIEQHQKEVKTLFHRYGVRRMTLAENERNLRRCCEDLRRIGYDVPPYTSKLDQWPVISPGVKKTAEFYANQANSKKV